MTRRIDAHLHVWELARGGYDWLTEDAGPLYADFTADAAATALRASGIDAAVLVQARDSADETRYLLSLAAHHPFVLGAVGWVPLDDPAATSAFLATPHPGLVGLRSLLHTDPRADLLDREPVRESLREIAAHGLAFDVPDAWPRHLAQVERVATAVPGLTIVVNHLGKPPRGRADYGQWRDTLALVARHPSVVAKLSGLRAPGAGYSASDLLETYGIALDLFGPERLLWGSDWPMSVGDGDYADAVGPVLELVDSLAESERAAILAGTAERVYALAASSTEG